MALVNALGEGVLSAPTGVNGAPNEVGVGVILLLVEGALKLLLGDRRRIGESAPRVWTSSVEGPRDIGCPPTTGPIIMLIELRFEFPPLI